ncbi:porin [Bradyrhizobium ontarionense]|uniref:Porin n=1 Tax=Bradyrhizobium ontarionense TaxID=2898149 RepID=A0ABY3RFI4_9BRAD|nr:porin [Bradyrhizobium sp. A19]UFZ05588.1 porin [Bradyrhizobium sp. A19]
MFRSLALGTTAWLIVVAVAFAGSPGAPLPSPQAAGTNKSAPRRSAVATNPCASYGADFVRVEGTDTCVKVGGAARVEMGSSVRH